MTDLAEQLEDDGLVEEVVKVRLGDLKPNPCRETDSYEYDEDLLTDLKASIDKRGFLRNTPVRLINGEYVLATGGHHRLKALIELKGEDYEVLLPLLPGGSKTDCLIDMTQECFDGVRSTKPRRLIHTIYQIRKHLIEFFKSNPEALKQYVENGEAKPETLTRVMNNIEEGKLGADIIERYISRECAIEHLPKSKIKEAVRAVRMADEDKIDICLLAPLKNYYQLKTFLDYVRDDNTPLDEQDDLVHDILDGVKLPSQKDKDKSKKKESNKNDSNADDEPETGDAGVDNDEEEEKNVDVAKLVTDAVENIDQVMLPLQQVFLCKAEAEKCSGYKDFVEKLKELNKVCESLLKE